MFSISFAGHGNESCCHGCSAPCWNACRDGMFKFCGLGCCQGDSARELAVADRARREGTGNCLRDVGHCVRGGDCCLPCKSCCWRKEEEQGK